MGYPIIRGQDNGLSEGRIMAYPRAGYGTKNVSFQKNSFIIFQE